jgi:hypothetical protein
MPTYNRSSAVVVRIYRAVMSRGADAALRRISMSALCRIRKAPLPDQHQLMSASPRSAVMLERDLLVTLDGSWLAYPGR